jgi:LacI family transcriptional regulator
VIATTLPERVPRKRATLREVAAATGLSPAAVSYALRGQQVAPETIERVRRAADELGYEADPIARALRGGATGTIGLVAGSLADFWTQELVRAVQREVRLGDTHTIVADADGDPDRALQLAGRLVDQRVDGLVVVPVPIAPTDHSWDRIARAVATVTIGGELGVPTRGAVVFDYDTAVTQLLSRLASRGYQRIVVLSWAIGSVPDRGVEKAIRTQADQLGLDAQIVACAYSLNGSEPLAADLLASADRPGAVVCLSDSIAYGVYSACRELGLVIPTDVAVTGFDAHPISRLLTPPLTTIDWDVDAVARHAVRMLRGEQPAADPARMIIAPRLVAGGSD